MSIKSECVNKTDFCSLKLGGGFTPVIPKALMILKFMRLHVCVTRFAFISIIMVGFIFCNSAFVHASINQPLEAAGTQVFTGTVASVSAPQSEHISRASIFKQAVADDAARRHEQARRWYDALEGVDMHFSVAVPSAVNLAVLGRYDDAKKAFAKIAKSGDQRAASYAQLWQLWLTARTYTGGSVALEKTLKKMAGDMRPGTAYQQKLISVFSGEGQVEEVFTTINTTVVEGLPMRDARSEAAFFAGGYLQYVRKDVATALRLYQRELSQAGSSVERPLIEQAINSL